jgi:hypothetical protein
MIVPAQRTTTIRQRDFAGGLSIWGSNPAIVWTATRSEEEGIHLHAFDSTNKIVIDDTYSALNIDGVDLDPGMVRVYMAQSALPHIAGRVRSIFCVRCGAPHFDTNEYAFTPHEHHLCVHCGFEFRARSRFRKTIGNPACDAFAKLSAVSQRPARHHKSHLLIESP